MKTIIKQAAALIVLAIGATGLCLAQEAPPAAPSQQDEKILEIINKEGKGFSIRLDLGEDILDSDFGEKLEREIERELSTLSDDDVGAFFRDKKDWDDSFGEAVLVPLFAIVFIFGMPVFIVGLVISGKHRRRKLMHETIGKMVEKGVEIPPELLQEQGEAPSTPASALRRGIILMGVGLGLIGFFGLDGDMDGIGIGFIPLFIGLAYLVAWKLEGNQEQQAK